ncbi:MAG: sulfide/dihydroorotate dehydrogenase-like FAD/NAD-binding protein [Eubacteriales bacterium]|nr:sulfide/dihydroorotate dehydrogenase-like FAD/NAD-binding protein [Eubacteriales bacterium]
MYKILSKRRLNKESVEMEIEAPHIARKAKPGQFIIFRVDEKGERVPLTVAGTNPETGAVKIIFQQVGGSTMALGNKEAGEYIQDFVGPLGKPSELDQFKGKKIAVAGGGLGAAIAYPIAKYAHSIGADVDMIAGFRNKDIIILEDEMRANSTRCFITTDDGSNGTKGFVSDILEQQIQAGTKYDHVICIGPMIMMKVTCDVTRKYNIPTTVSMCTIMVDGTGMCGCCRLTVDGETKFACVDGPDFDGHLVDFDEAMARSRVYRAQEAEDKEHMCRLTGEVR